MGRGNFLPAAEHQSLPYRMAYLDPFAGATGEDLRVSQYKAYLADHDVTVDASFDEDAAYPTVPGFILDSLNEQFESDLSELIPADFTRPEQWIAASERLVAAGRGIEIRVADNQTSTAVIVQARPASDYDEDGWEPVSQEAVDAIAIPLLDGLAQGYEASVRDGAWTSRPYARTLTAEQISDYLAAQCETA
jgi:hypothetical protein